MSIGKMRLKQLLHKESIEIVDELLLRLGASPCEVIDEAGESLVGRDASDSEYAFPIDCEGQRIGCVRGEPSVEIVARFLNHLVSMESEKRMVIQDALVKYREMSFLCSVSEHLLGSLSLPDIAQAVASRTMKILKSSGALLMTLDKSEWQLSVLSAEGTERLNLSSKRSINRFYASIISSVKGEIVNNPGADTRFSGDPESISSSTMCVPLTAKNKVLGLFQLTNVLNIPYTSVDLRLLSSIAFQTSLAMENSILYSNLEAIVKERTNELLKALEEVEKAATTDLLTGVMNRTKFDEIFNYEMERSERYCRPLSLLFFDVDHFKTINDTLGHRIGDDVLKNIAATVKGSIRDSDIFARWGGDEFVILAVETDIGDALTLAERIRKKVESSPFKGAEKISISVGVSARKDGDSMDILLTRADDSLYKAKRKGRNRCEISE